MRNKENKELDIKTKDAWDRNWEDITTQQALEMFSYPRVKKQVEIFRHYISKEKRVLEGGCGIGSYVVYFRELNYDIIGIDYNYSPLAGISAYKPDVPLVCADVSKIPFTDNSFGTYLSLGVIEHFSGGPEPAIKEAYRVLESGGFFLIIVPRRSIFHKIKLPVNFLKQNKMLRRVFKRPLSNNYWQQYFKISELTKMLQKNNFEIIKIFPIDHAHSLLSSFNIFRDKNALDGANGPGLRLAKFLEKHMPWSTAAGMLLICRKTE